MTRPQRLPSAARTLAVLGAVLACAAPGLAQPVAPAAIATGPALPDAPWARPLSPFSPASPQQQADEARIERILASMTLAQKVGQMTQPDIRHVTPAQVRQYAIGSVLNGGGAWPGDAKHAAVGDWLALARAYHEASMATGLPDPVPVVWGTDAVHGHGNVFGATLFPHHIGQGAAGDEELVRDIARATAQQVRATGIRWVFAPTLAVAQDDRWGRTYESFSEDPAIVRRLGAAAVRGYQGDTPADLRQRDDTVIANAKHYLGDGGTHEGADQGLNRASAAELQRIHAAGHESALGAGVQTVMASFHSWQLPDKEDGTPGTDFGKVHGSHALLTQLLKQRMGFDGLVVSDWNGIGQVRGCRDDRCAQALNAGIDLVMVPEDWPSFIANTVAQVQAGEIPLARIDDAVRRILRVKLRAGVFERPPGAGRHDGDAQALVHRELARRAVRQSLVLLKNNAQVLPLSRGQRVLVVGRGADSVAMQAGGWSLTWQGTGNTAADFPNGQSVLGALREVLGPERVLHSADGRGIDPAAYDAVIAVIGEQPYAEGNGDIPPSGTLHHATRHPEDLAALQAVAGRGKPVVTVLLSGRPLYVNDLINLSDAFVAAWLPGTEGGGIVDVLLRDAQGGIAHPPGGRLPFSWPRSACQTPLNAGDGQQPLFALGHGLRYGQPGDVPRLDAPVPSGGCGASQVLPIFRAGQAQGRHGLELMGLVPALQRTRPMALADDPNAVQHLRDPARPADAEPLLTARTTQLLTQHDARELRWRGPAAFLAWAPQPMALGVYPDAALVFALRVSEAPAAPVRLGMRCGGECGADVDLAPWLGRQPAGERLRVVLPLACLAARGLDLGRVGLPFHLATDGAFTATVADIRIEAGAARWPEALACDTLPR